MRLISLLVLTICPTPALVAAQGTLRAGFAEVEITPDVRADKPVWIAGYGHGRKATGIHDPLMARCVVLGYGQERIALVAVDLVGLQYSEVKRIRAELSDYRYVLVASTHNHEGPDVIGIWGAMPFQRGVDERYLQFVIDRCVQAVRTAEPKLEAARVAYGTANADSLLRDSREPYLKDGVVRVLRFTRAADGEPLGLVTQFSCHPESLGSRNTLLTADFPYATVARLKAVQRCPVVYFSGAVGGLMTNPRDPLRDRDGLEHRDGTFGYARAYGEAVADVMTQAVHGSRPVLLVPFTVSARPVAVPVQNKVYRAARELGVLRRAGLVWKGDPSQIVLQEDGVPASEFALETEVAYLRLGEVHVAGIPGELYPELVYGRVQDPADPAADFPEAPVEPAISQIFPTEKWLVLGLANDEIGYIVPKRQWDADPPFCYGRPKSQYGEINSCGPDVAPIIMRALSQRFAEAGQD